MSEAVTSATNPPRGRTQRLLRAIAIAAAVLLLLVGAGIVYLGSDHALQLVLRRAVAASDGKLQLSGAEGSLLSTIRVKRIAWNGDDVVVEADDTALNWSITDLLSRRFNVRGLGARRLAITLKPDPDSETQLPASLALPLEVSVSNIGIARLEWKNGDRSGTISALSFDYRGGAQAHAVRNLQLNMADGALRGDIDLGADAPFPLTARLALAGAGRVAGLNADASATGTLDRTEITAKATMHGARVSAVLVAAPMAKSPLVAATIDAQDVDLAKFVATLPATRLALHAKGVPTAEGYTGKLELRNADAGPLDRDRIPLETLDADATWSNSTSTLALDNLTGRFDGGGSARGSALVPVDGAPSQWRLSVAAIDLARIHSALRPTQLAGTLSAGVAERRQEVAGDLTQDGLALAFAGTVVGDDIDIARFRARSGASVASGSGRISWAGARAFTLAAETQKFDPARFGEFPAASLDAKIALRGSLLPAWDVTGSIDFARGSKLLGVPISGAVRGHASPGRLEDADAALALATATLRVSGGGSVNKGGLTYSLDAPQLAELRPLIKPFLPAIPATISGALRARGTLTLAPGGPGATVEGNGIALQWSPLLRVATLRFAGSFAAGGASDARVGLDARALSVKLTAGGVVMPSGRVGSIDAEVVGSLAQHRASFNAKGDGFATEAQLVGSLSSSALAWSGTVESLSNKGAVPLRLTAPAQLAVARESFRVGAAQIEIAEGRATLQDLRLEAGRLNTAGSYSGVPFSALARLFGVQLPLASTLVIGGEWAIVASPRMNGTIALRRERGDLYAAESATLQSDELALGLSRVDLTASIIEDRVTLQGALRSARAGSVDLGVVVEPGQEPGAFSGASIISGKLSAALPSLRAVQPWLGTTSSMDGQANLALQIAGTLAQPRFEGQLNADDLTIDVPSYGVHLTEGVLRATLGDRSIVVDQLRFVAGEGHFSASGTMARAATAEGATSATSANNASAASSAGGARLTWTAENFRLANRPDLRLVVNGSGALAVVERRLELTGRVDVIDGLVAYAPTAVGRLGPDVVVKGQPRAPEAPAGERDLPLRLDLDVRVADRVTFTGDGLNTRLEGRVRVTTGTSGALQANGTIEAINGTYVAFGQRLTIDRGRLTFDGPANNPALDIVALRKNLAVEAGVEVTGTVRVPRVRLVSNPPVPDGEKLSWLLTGQGLDRASRNDIAALSAASAAILTGNQTPIATRLANTIGLDDISLRDSSSQATAGTSQQVVAFGKRISDRLTLVYEQGLTLATNALRIEYTLSRSVTLRAEAGVVGSVGIFYRRSFD